MARRLIRTVGDGVAWRTFVERVDRISLLVLSSSILLLVGMALEIPVDPTGLASICRSRANGSDGKPVSATVPAQQTRLETTKPTR